MKFETRCLVYAATYPSVFILILLLVQLCDGLYGLELYRYGNYPLDISQLYGPFLQPLFHSGFDHLGSNAVPLFILMWSLFYFYGDVAFAAYAWIWVGSGLFTWFIGRPSYHIGASGLIYGLLFFLFFSGIFRKIRELMALSVLLVFLYGSIVWGMLPVAQLIEPDASWEGHLSGAFTGLLVAVYFRNHPPQRKVEPEPDTEDEDHYSGPIDSSSEPEGKGEEKLLS